MSTSNLSTREDEKLRTLEQSLESFQTHLQKLLASSKQYAKTGSLKEALSFTEELGEYGSKHDQDGGETGVAKLGSVLDTIEQARRDLLGRLETGMKPLESFLKNDILSVLVAKRKVEKAKEEFEANQLKIDIIRSMVTPEKLAQYETTLAESKRTYEKLAEKYSAKLEAIETRQRFEVLEPLATFVLGQLEFYRQSFQQLSQLEDSLKSSIEELRKQRAKFLETHVAEPEIETSNLQALSKYGFLMVKENDSWERRWVAVANGFLYIYRDSKDTNTMSTHILLSATAKRTSPELSVLISIPVPRTIVLQPTPEEEEGWLNVIQNTATTLSALFKDKEAPTTNERFIKSNLYYISEANSVCADCGTKDAEFVLPRYGGIVCVQCATTHRKIGSQTKSLFENRLEPEELHILSVIGNERLNSVLEQKISSTKHIAKPKEDADLEVKERYVRAKYEKKRFVEVPESMADEAASTKALVDAINANSLEKILDLIAWGANLDAIVDPQQRTTILHSVLVDGKAILAVLSLLLHNGANVHAQDAQQRTPLHLAALHGREGYIRLLVTVSSASVSSKDADGKTPAMLVTAPSSSSVKVLLLSESGSGNPGLSALKDHSRSSKDQIRNSSGTETRALSGSSSKRSLSVGTKSSDSEAAAANPSNTDGATAPAADGKLSSGSPEPAQQSQSLPIIGIEKDSVNAVVDGSGSSDEIKPEEEPRLALLRDTLALLSQQYRPPVDSKKEEERTARIAALKTSVADCTDLLRARLNILRKDLQNATDKAKVLEIAKTIHELRLALLVE